MAQRPEFDVPSSPGNVAGILATASAADIQDQAVALNNDFSGDDSGNEESIGDIDPVDGTGDAETVETSGDSVTSAIDNTQSDNVLLGTEDELIEIPATSAAPVRRCTTMTRNELRIFPNVILWPLWPQYFVNPVGQKPPVAG